MENPQTWTELEIAVHDAILEWQDGRDAGCIGYSQAAYISNKLRNAQLVVDDERTRVANNNPVQRSFDR
jgi:hypothetical protein